MKFARIADAAPWSLVTVNILMSSDSVWTTKNPTDKGKHLRIKWKCFQGISFHRCKQQAAESIRADSREQPAQPRPDTALFCLPRDPFGQIAVSLCSTQRKIWSLEIIFHPGVTNMPQFWYLCYNKKL